jgi:hypothetical protein
VTVQNKEVDIRTEDDADDFTLNESGNTVVGDAADKSDFDNAADANESVGTCSKHTTSVVEEHGTVGVDKNKSKLSPNSPSELVGKANKAENMDEEDDIRLEGHLKSGSFKTNYCPFCKFELKDYNSGTFHMHQHADLLVSDLGDGLYQCKFCAKEVRHWWKHVKLTVNEKVCSSCSKEMFFKCEFTQHLQVHRKGQGAVTRNYRLQNQICSVCGKMLSNK